MFLTCCIFIQKKMRILVIFIDYKTYFYFSYDINIIRTLFLNFEYCLIEKIKQDCTHFKAWM